MKMSRATMLAAAGFTVIAGAGFGVAAIKAQAPVATASIETANVTYDSQRADCPGQITCPITGELVCADRCPLDENATDKAEQRPACCVAKTE